MADFTVTGFINTVKYLPDAALVFIDEFKRGYEQQIFVELYKES